MQFVQVVLTDSQVSMVASAVKNAAIELGPTGGTETQQLLALADFFYAVEANPDGFPVTQPAAQRSIKKMVARQKGPAQPKPNKRTRAKLRSQGSQKRTRAQKREEARLFNEAREAAEAARLIEEAAEERARIEALGIVLPE